MVAAAVSIITSLILDVRAQEHPTHTAVLGVVALAVAVARRPTTRRLGDVLSAVCGALAAQPALHAASVGLTLGPGVSYDGRFHEILADAPMTAGQVAVPVIAVVAGSLFAHLHDFLGHILRSPFRLPRFDSLDSEFEEPRGIRAVPYGSMLHWCGWAIRMARRGPPLLAA